MKLASRISSIRRIAWKQCRSCSADSLSMWRDSLARKALAGWMRSPRASSTAVTGCWASQSISRSGWSLRSSSAIATSRCAWPSPIGEEMKRARLRRDLPRTQRPGRRRGLDEVAQQQVHLDRVAHVRAVARSPPAATRSPPVASASAMPRRGAGDRVVACRGSRAPDSSTRRRSSRTVSSSSRGASWVATSVSGVVSRPQPTQSSIGFVECGSVKHLREEELEEAAVVARASSGGCTWPSPRRCRAPRPTGRASAPGRSRPSGTAGQMKTAPSTRSG